MNRLKLGCALLLAAVAAPASGEVRVVPAPAAAAMAPLPTHVGGRAQQRGTGAAPRWVRQWPGTYFETAFQGAGAGFRVGAGAVILNVIVDGRALPPLVKPAPGVYRIEGLAPGRHVARVEVATED